MAENKKSVLLYCDIIHAVEELSDEEAGKLFKHYLRYINDLDPVAPDKITKIVFEPIKQTLKRDLKKWEKTIESKSRAGLASANKRQQASTPVKSVEQNLTQSTVSVKDNVIVNDSDKESKEENLRPPDLSKSNLFRQPTIPTKEKVTEVFLRRGGNLEMAKKFFEKNSATGWFIRGSPITNFENLVPSFITNWKENGTDKVTNTTGVKLSASEAREQARASY